MADEQSKRKHFSATVSARVLYALTPLLRQTMELAHSDFAFMSQMQTRHFGLYLLPADEGIAVVVVQNAAVLAVRDKAGTTTEPLRISLPDEMLDVLAPRFVTLRDENGIPFIVEGEPKADRVTCVDGFGMVFLDKAQSERFDGCLGTWFNGDHGNYIDEGSYRAAPANVEFLYKVFRAAASQADAVRTVAVNPDLLQPITEAARRMSTVLDLTVGGANDPISIRSVDDAMCGLLMPMNGDERTPSTFLDVLRGKEKATTATA